MHVWAVKYVEYCRFIGIGQIWNTLCVITVVRLPYPLLYWEYADPYTTFKCVITAACLLSRLLYWEHADLYHYKLNLPQVYAEI